MTVRTFSQISFLATAFAFATPAVAGSDDYAFQPVQAEVTKGDESPLLYGSYRRRQTSQCPTP